MKTIKSLVLLFSVLCAFPIHAERNPFLCWLWDFEGCPGVTPRQGRAMNMFNTGRGGPGAIGARTERVETRTIIRVPEYRMRRFWRSLGLGGNRINISYSEHGGGGCPDQEWSAPEINNTLLTNASFDDCMQALQNDLRDLPNGIQLNVVQCQDIFCNEQFLSKFTDFLNQNQNFNVRNQNRFLGCDYSSYDI